MIFETERLLVRHYVFDTDRENFYLLNGDEEVMRYIRPVKTRDECDIFLQEIIAKGSETPSMGRWAAIEKETGNFIGSFAIIPIEETGTFQLGYALLKKFWGKGFASGLTEAGLRYYFSSTKAEEVYAITEEANTVSQKVLLKNGFVPDGTREEGGKQLLVFIARKTNKIQG